MSFAVEMMGRDGRQKVHTAPIIVSRKYMIDIGLGGIRVCGCSRYYIEHGVDFKQGVDWPGSPKCRSRSI